MADSTVSPTLGSNAGVKKVIRMPIHTVGFSSVLGCKANSTQGILSGWDRF